MRLEPLLGRAVRSVAKKAGIPEMGYAVPFEARLKSEVRPHAPVLRLRARTAYDFTVTWWRPTIIDGDGDGTFATISHYAIELATTAPNGTYYPWSELVCLGDVEPHARLGPHLTPA